jgi:hypothetical protein
MKIVNLWLTLSGLCLSATILLHCGPVNSQEPVIRLSENTVEVPATVHQEDFLEDMMMPGYHFLTWERGRAAGHTLFLTPVTDIQLLEALESLGAVPGDALGTDTWDERRDPSSLSPDKIIEGPKVEVLVRVPGKEKPLTLDAILIDPGGKGFDMRFGGHSANIPKWKSGCVVCLYSCPGSKVGNASYTVRDFVKGATEFRVRPGVLPEDGTEVTIIFRLLDEKNP